MILPCVGNWGFMENQERDLVKHFLFWLLILPAIAIVFSIIGHFWPQSGKKAEKKYYVEEQSKSDAVVSKSIAPSIQQKEVEKIKRPIYYAIIKNVDQFKMDFNTYAKESQSSLRIRKIIVEPGEVHNAFQYSFSDGLAIVGTLNKKDNSIRSLIMTAQGDGTLNSGLNMLVVMGAIITSTNPSLTDDERGDVLYQLGLFDDEVDISKLSGRTIKNGIKYFVDGIPQVGIMFGAQNSNE